ncbi:MAG TPA: 2OG-Fe(II) oxygenase [Rhodanobacteraceae bacterium]|nr:2OG-Fe(II) oxygenase [Rhodanobacteraceae bacterium]
MASGNNADKLHDWIRSTARAGHDIPAILKMLADAGYPDRDSRRIVAKVLDRPAVALDTTVEATRVHAARHPPAPIADAGDRRVRVSASLDKPVVRVLDGLLDADECAGLIDAARPRLDRATTVATDGSYQVDQRRTSHGMFFKPAETPLVARIEQRLAALTGIPAENGEGLQILHYLPSQQYEPHYDWFDPAQPGYSAITRHGGQRIASIVMYLNTPLAGGGTAFPEVGFTVTALAGSAVYFAYHGGDKSSLHAGLPVIDGEKWIATKWLRERPFR